MRSPTKLWIAVLAIGVAALWSPWHTQASGLIQSAYNLIENGGAPVTRQPTLNFVNGGCVNNAGTNATDCTITGGGGSANANFYSQAFVSQTSVALTDNSGTTTKTTQCYDAASPPNLIIPQNVAITDANNVTVTFGASQSGTCIVAWAASGLILGTATKTIAYTFAASDYLIVGDTTGGSFSVKLEAAPKTGQIHVLKKSVAANTLTLDGNGKNIDGVATIAINAQYTSYTVQYDGTVWWIE